MKRQTQIASLFDEIQQDSALQPGIDHLRKSEGGRISLASAGPIVGMPRLAIAPDLVSTCRLEFGWQDQRHPVQIGAELYAKLAIVLCLLRSIDIQTNGMVVEFIGIIKACADGASFFFVLPAPIDGRVEPEPVCA